MFYVIRRKRFGEFNTTSLTTCNCTLKEKSFCYLDCRAPDKSTLPVALLPTEHKCGIIQNIHKVVDGTQVGAVFKRFRSFQDKFSIKIWEF